MERKKIKKEDLGQWLGGIREKYQLVAPVQKNVVQFSEVSSRDEAVLESANSVLPPKGFFFPQTERLFTFRKEAGELHVKPQGCLERERVIFGMRRCDIQSLLLLDRVFGGESQDSHYLEKREKTIIVGLACADPDRTCFCRSFDIDPFSADGIDILLTDLGGAYLVDVSTHRGAEVVKLSAGLFSSASPEDEEKFRELRTRALAKIRDIETDGIGAKLDSAWDDRLWSDLGEICIGCGVCTYLCPTCHCFDIQDEDWGQAGMRFRCWDSCIFSEFTLMASGENPRPTKRERIRQRFFHKFRYFPEKYGVFACVGCGRCLSKCPVSIDITQILKRLRAES